MRAFILSVLLFLGFSQPAFAQSDEIVVTGSRIQRSMTTNNDTGIFIEKKGDYLLLEVTIENDSRDLATRLSEIEATINNMMEAAKKDKSIELSLIDKGNVVRTLNVAMFNSNVVRGVRPDTSLAHLKVKTNIPNNVQDAFKLSTKLAKFVDGIKEVGRTKIETYDQVAVSIVNPYQHRAVLIKAIINDINSTTKALNGEYRVVLNGMDSRLQWARSGDLNLAFYMDYSFKIIPASLTNYAD